ncbi:MAG: DUF2306 domain-containing protein [Terracidiphilus sp.]
MSTSAHPVAPVPPFTSRRWPKALALGAVLFVAAAFVFKYVFHYYLHYNEAAFNDPAAGAANYWRMRGWLLLHISSGMTAALIGPWQFSQRLRKRYLQLHRLSGRVYVIAVMCGCVGALGLAIGTTFGKAWGFGVAMLAFAWFTTTSMAYYAVRQRQIQIHREWMVRSYVVTFAFVTFRIFNDYPPMKNWLPDADRANVMIWACWALPLLVTEVILQLKRMPRPQNLAVREK